MRDCDIFQELILLLSLPDIMNNNPIVTRYKDRAHVQFAEFDRIDWNRMKPKCFSSFGLVLNFLFRRSFYICMEYPDKLGRLTFINALAFRWHVTIFHSDSFYWKVYAENGIQTRTKWFFSLLRRYNLKHALVSVQSHGRVCKTRRACSLYAHLTTTIAERECIFF